MSTTEVTTWAIDIATVGPIYPFVGTEVYWYIAGLVFWLAFHIMQGRIETRELNKEEEAMSSPERLKEALEARDHQDRH